ncbi:c-type cytochrome [Hydrogenimonas sp.]
MFKRAICLLPALLFAAPEGASLYMAKGCYGCHGTAGEGIGDYPAIAGRPQKELARKLHDLKRGIGYTSKRDMMIPFAKALSDEEIEALAHYLSRIDEKREEEEVPPDILGGFGS